MTEPLSQPEARDSEEVAPGFDDAQIGLETPDVDAGEQRTPADENDRAGVTGRHRGFDVNEVDEADAADQERAVEFDEDDYR